MGFTTDQIIICAYSASASGSYEPAPNPTGSVEITGSLTVTGSIATTGTFTSTGTATLTTLNSGYNLISGGTYQTVVGQNNAVLDVSGTVFVVGTGLNEETLSNGFAVTTYGTAVLPTIYSGAYPARSGSQGEFMFADAGAGAYYMYVFLGNNWRRISLPTT